MTNYEEMRHLRAKAFKRSRKKENCKTNTHFYNVFWDRALRLWRGKKRKTVPKCTQECAWEGQKCDFWGPSWCVPISRIIIPTAAGSIVLQKRKEEKRSRWKRRQNVEVKNKRWWKCKGFEAAKNQSGPQEGGPCTNNTHISDVFWSRAWGAWGWPKRKRSKNRAMWPTYITKSGPFWMVSTSKNWYFGKQNC